ncbi:hypothetical protein OsJ_21759 [Oryza sativa Japonica Group]|uniref:Senescence-associated protein n=1 Tax=Oryza sativa subsp. japonica TaxID=39947 RepID=A3BCY5_ORYSJ|nr:hypothetical protein OsJ_21759 [Oryza sativa Japonica Group]
MAVSNNITACVNFLALVCAVPVVATGVWFASKQGDDCARVARWPLAILGAALLLVALAGFAGAYWNRRGLLAAYLFAMAALITLLLALLVFAFAVTRPSGAYPAFARAYDDYRLDGYSTWLRDRVAGEPRRWEGIRACLRRFDTWQEAGAGRASSSSPPSSSTNHTSPRSSTLQFFYECANRLKRKGEGSMDGKVSGCCKPPTVCGYAYVSPTVWVNPANPAADADCAAWGNDPSQLCYECSSCKAGMLGTLREQWRRANVALVIATVALIFFYVIGCSAFKNAQTEDLFRRYKWRN